MGVKEEIQYIEQEISSLRENRKSLEKDGSIEQKSLLYKKVSAKLNIFVRRMKIRLFILGFYNKELKRKLYSVAETIEKVNDLLAETSFTFEKHEKGEDENVIEYGITAKQLEKKIKQLDKDLLEKARLLQETMQKPLYAEIGAMLFLRMAGTFFVLFEKEAESTAMFFNRLEKASGILESANRMSPLNAKNRHRPTNNIFPF